MDSISVSDCDKLDLSEFNFSDVVDALTHNCSITKLELINIDVDPDGQRQINEELDKNKLIVEHIFPRVHEQRQ